jgi:hypothetical protein
MARRRGLMSVRNSSELGINLMKMAELLLKNSRLCRLLKYTDEDPLSVEIHPVEPERKLLLHKNIKVVPLVNEEENDTESTVVLVFGEGTVDENNKEFKELLFDILIYVPLSEWLLNDINLRPFLIMSEIEKSIKGKRVESLGTIDYLGFNLHLITDIMSCYKMRFSIDVYN